MYFDPHLSQPFGNTGKGGAEPSSQLDLVEAEHSVGKHDRMAQSQLPPQRPAQPKPLPPPGNEERDAATQQRKYESDRGGSKPEHPRGKLNSVRAKRMEVTWPGVVPRLTSPTQRRCS